MKKEIGEWNWIHFLVNFIFFSTKIVTENSLGKLNLRKYRTL